MLTMEEGLPYGTSETEGLRGQVLEHRYFSSS